MKSCVSVFNSIQLYLTIGYWTQQCPILSYNLMFSWLISCRRLSALCLLPRTHNCISAQVLNPCRVTLLVQRVLSWCDGLPYTDQAHRYNPFHLPRCLPVYSSITHCLHKNKLGKPAAKNRSWASDPLWLLPSRAPANQFVVLKRSGRQIRLRGLAATILSRGTSRWENMGDRTKDGQRTAWERVGG